MGSHHISVVLQCAVIKVSSLQDRGTYAARWKVLCLVHDTVLQHEALLEMVELMHVMLTG